MNNLTPTEPMLPLHDRYVELLHVLGFAPLLACTDSLGKAVAICALFVTAQCVFLLGTRGLARLVPPPGYLPVAVLVGTLTTALLMLGVLWFHYERAQQLGVYLPLLAVNATLYLNSLRGITASSTVAALRGTLPGVVAMCVVALLIALLRFALEDSFAALATPFGALITLSLLLAGARYWQQRRSIAPDPTP